MTTDTINREASPKGFRLQKLRAIKLVLDSFEQNENAHVYAAIEHIEDVFFKDCASETGEYFEQDKDYDQESAFTFASDEVLNTIVSFVDTYFKWECNPNKLKFGFYATNKVGKERTSDRTKKLSIKLPTHPILILLRDAKYSEKDLLESVKKFVINEYECQYSGTNKGNLGALSLFSDRDWIDFVSCIDWKFGQSDDVELKQELLQDIAKSKLFNSSMDGKEEVILAQLLELFESRQCAVDRTDRFVYGADVRLKFLLVAGGMPGYIKIDDPVWNDWKRLPPPGDKRSLADKILAVSPTYGKRKLQSLARKIGMARTLEEHFPDVNMYHSIKYRILVECEDALLSEIDYDNPGSYTEEQVDDLFDKIAGCATEHLNQINSTFKYNYNVNTLVPGIVLDLFNECYLAFDEQK